MLVWSTQIPVISSKTNDDLASLCAKWITGSPHSTWTEELIPHVSTDGIVSKEHDGQRISVGQADSNGANLFGFRHYWKDGENREWITEVIGCHRNQSFLVGVHLFCQTAGVGVRVSNPKKPYIVRQILDELGGDVDGEFQVSDKPHLLEESQVDLAGRVLTGKMHLYLPIIYVSSTWRNEPALDPAKLSQWAGGMAHVVVEPSRAFSFILADRVGRANPYEGAVSIIWPEGGGSPSRFFPHRFDDPVRFSSAIANVLRKALAGRRPDRKVTWELLRELILRDRIERLRTKGTTNVEDYIEAFDEELKLTKARADELEEENGRLKRELANQQACAYGQNEGLIQEPTERELFPGEYTDILVRVLVRAQDNSQPDGRVRDVLCSLLETNTESGESARIEKQIRSAVGSCKNIGTTERKALEEAGFEASDDGKHYKFVFRGDNRYTFAMSKTGSDWRGMKNWVSDVTKRLFK